MAHAVAESPGAGLAVASELGVDGRSLADSVQNAFSSGLGRAMTVGAVLALLTAVFTLWRGPRRSSALAGDAYDSNESAAFEAALATAHGSVAP